MKAPIAYIDADILLHRAVSFVDKEFDGEPMNDWKLALYYFHWLKDKWLKELGPHTDYYLILSVGPNFRAHLYDDYKGNRKDIEPHPAFHDLKEAVKEDISALWELGIEADDLMGIKVSEDKDTIALSADKDFATVPCRLMIPTSHGRKKPNFHKFSEAEADVNWMRQTLTGDTIDNFKGAKGIGPKKALAIVPDGTPLATAWPKVLRTFLEKGHTAAEALTNARLARILRHGDYDFENQKVLLWTP